MAPTPDRTPVVVRALRDARVFVTESVRTFTATGAVAPSGRALTRAITHPLTQPRGRPVRVLEVGPGTGVFTAELLARLGPDDELDVVEVNPRFAQQVRELVVGAAPTVRVHQALVQDAIGDGRLRGPYDAVVCGLPMTNFPPEVVRELMDQLLGVLAPGGVLGYFAYLGTLRLRRLTGSRAQVRRHTEVEQVLRGLRVRRGLRSTTVVRNLPPARALFLLA